MTSPVARALFTALAALALLTAVPGPVGARQPGRPPALPGPTAPAAEPGRAERGESFLRWMIRASGVIGLVILGMSLYLVAVVTWMFLTFRRSLTIPPALVHELGERLAQKHYDEAFQLIAADRSFLARTLTAGVRRLPSGVAASQRALELANEDITMEMEHRTTYLATVGTLGPMIGLIGTVYGMIRSFEVIATAGSSPQASQLAEGISTALFATLEGIALSVPAIAFYAFFRNRIARLSLEVQIAAEGLLDQFAPGVRPPHPLIAGAAPPPRAALPPRE